MKSTKLHLNRLLGAAGVGEYAAFFVRRVCNVHTLIWLDITSNFDTSKSLVDTASLRKQGR